MGLRRWLGLGSLEESNVVTQAAMLEDMALGEIVHCIDRINELMPILTAERRRVNLWVDRSERPYMLQLTDWEDAYPRVIAGER